MATWIHHICPAAQWQAAAEAGHYGGGAQDAADGFIHFSSSEQVAGSAARYWHGKDDLVLITVDGERLGSALRWEKSRGGALFPHLYGTLAVADVARVAALKMTADGGHALPDDPEDGS